MHYSLGCRAAQLYEDNPGALNRDYALLLPSDQTTTADHASAQLSAAEVLAPADSEKLQGHGSSSAAPAEQTFATLVAAEPRDTQVGEVSIAASEAASTAVETHLSRLEKNAQSFDAAPQPSADTTERNVSAPTTNELPIRRLRFSREHPDAAGRTSSVTAHIQQAPSVATGGSRADEESSSMEHGPHAADASIAAKPQQRGRRLWGVWSLLRRGKHADREPPALSDAAGSESTDAVLRPEDSSAVASASQLPTGMSSEVAHAEETSRSGRITPAGVDQPGTVIVHAAEPAVGWPPEMPVSDAAMNVWNLILLPYMSLPGT